MTPHFSPLGIMPSSSNRYADTRDHRGRRIIIDAPLRLSAKGVRLEPGEKAYFVPSQSITDVDPTANYKELVNGKRHRSRGQLPTIQGAFSIFHYSGRRTSRHKNMGRQRKGLRTRRPRSIHGQFVLHLNKHPEWDSHVLEQRRNKTSDKENQQEFRTRQMGSARSFNKASDLMNFQSKLAGSNGFGGEGFHLRWKLPGTSTRMTFHEFNPRALIDGYQDGSGDLWEIEVIQNPDQPRNTREPSPRVAEF